MNVFSSLKKKYNAVPELRQAIIVMFISFGVLISALAVKINQDNRNKASTATGTGIIKLVSVQGQQVVGVPQQVQLKVNTGGAIIVGVTTEISVTGALPSDIAFTAAQVASFSGLVLDPTDVAGGKKWVIGYLADVFNPAFTTNGQDVVIGTFTYTPTSAGSLQFSFNPTESVMNIPTTTDTENPVDILRTPENITIAISVPSTPTPVPTVSPTLAPTMEPTPVPVCGAACSTNANCGPSLACVNGMCRNLSCVGSTDCVCPTPSPTPVPTPTSTPVVTIAPSPTATPEIVTRKINVRTKISGVEVDRGLVNASVVVGLYGSSVPVFQTQTALEYIGSGIYGSEIDLGTTTVLNATSEYWVIVKGEKHVGRSFKVLGSAAIWDFTTKLLQPGDLPVQDGVVNSSDISKLLAGFSKISPTAGDLAIADVNYDGVINSADMGLVISTLSSKPDETVL